MTGKVRAVVKKRSLLKCYHYKISANKKLAKTLVISNTLDNYLQALFLNVPTNRNYVQGYQQKQWNNQGQSSEVNWITISAVPMFAWVMVLWLKSERSSHKLIFKCQFRRNSCFEENSLVSLFHIKLQIHIIFSYTR